MNKIKVLLFGVGAVGSMIAKFLLEKEDVEIVGAVDLAENKVGRDLGQVLGLRNQAGVRISDDVDSVLSRESADVAVHATSSFLKDTFQQIASILKHGVNVVSTCEELSFPYFSEPILAKKLDDLAKKSDATVIGTGINPGFLMDTLVITLTAPCKSIQKIEAARVMNASTRRLPFQKKIGAGLSVTEFQQKTKSKEITGHVGLRQSIDMIGSALSWKLDQVVVEPAKPVIASRKVSSEDISVEAGKVAGLRQKAEGLLKKKEMIVLDFQAYLGAKEEYDSIKITGVPNVTQKIQPCIHGDLGTTAMIVNMIPKVIAAPAGLLTMKDLPVPCAVLGTISKRAE